MLVCHKAGVGRQVHMLVGQSAGVGSQMCWSVK